MMLVISITPFLHILLLYEYLSESLIIRPKITTLIANLPLYDSKHINSNTSNINRLNLAIGGDVVSLSNGKAVILVNDNPISNLVKAHLDIAGINTYVYSTCDLFTIISDIINFRGVPPDSAVVIGCNLTLLQYIWWKIKSILNNLVLITGDSNDIHSTISCNGTLNEIWIRFCNLLKSQISINCNSVLSTELTAGILASESIKSITGINELMKTPLNHKILTPKSDSIDILLIGVGAVGSEMIRMLYKMGFLSTGSKITIVDFDKVDSVNLTTQLVYNSEDVGKYKVNAIESYLKRLHNSENDNLKIIPISAIFEGNIAKKIFAHWIKSGENKNKLIIAAVDNFKARMLIDRYSLLYQIPLLEVGIDGTKASTSISIPYKTDPYSSMPGNSKSIASCSVKGIPNTTSDTALFGKLVVTKLLFKSNNFTQSGSQIRDKILGFFPNNQEKWFLDHVDKITSIALNVQSDFINQYGKNKDADNYLQNCEISRALIVELANLRARFFGLEPASNDTILAMVDDIIPSASFATSSIVALALSNLNLQKPHIIHNIKQHRNNNYKLSSDNGVMTLYFRDVPMLSLKLIDYNKNLRRSNYFWYFINLATSHFTKVDAPLIEVWRPSKCLFSNTGIGLSIWDVFIPYTLDMTTRDLAECYEAMFNAKIIGFITLDNNMNDEIIQIDETKLISLENCLGLRPIARIDNESVQLPDTLIDKL